ncbi:MAG: transposase family protein [Deltaproteobacteria bacterium]|nr:transposase family protein [Deltaproteobacteria bacterium]
MPKFLGDIITYFKTRPDLRVQGRSTYKLHQIVTILFIATTAGCKGWKEIHNFSVNYF